MKYLLKIKYKINYKLYRYISKILEFGNNIDRNRIFSESAFIESSVRLLPTAKVENLANNPNLIYIGDNSVIRGKLLVFAHCGKIQIGKDCYVGEDTRIWSADSIKIGDRVFISHNVNVHDTNSHSTDATLRYHHFLAIMSTGHPEANDYDIESEPILIEDDVWIGFNSTILKGVKIGKGSIVAACSVVTKNVPEFVIVAGNPAKVVKELKISGNST
jgi:maltose O-acetyltransferase